MKFSKSKQSLIKKFSFATTAVVTLILLVFSIIAIVYQIVEMEKQLNQRLENIGKTAGASLPSALWNLEGDVINDICASLLQEDALVYLRLSEGSNLRYENREKLAPGLKEKDFYFFEVSSRFITKSEDIYYEGQKIGTLQLVISKDSSRRALIASIVIVILLTIIIIAAISLTSILIGNRNIFRPLKKLEGSAAKIAERKLETKIDTSGEDEIGNLAKTFDQMRQDLKDHIDNLDKKVEDRTIELEKERDKAEKANKAKDTFIASVSHEIRTMLNSITGFTEQTLETPLNPYQEKNLNWVKDSSHDLLRVIDDILDYNKMVKGEMKIELSDFKLEEKVLEKVINRPDFQKQVQAKSIEVILDKKETVPAALRGDQSRLRQILTNLLNNAVKFTDVGSITLIVSCLRQDDTGADILFSVKDTGCGISKENQEKIFEPYEQLKDTKRKYSRGIGLGLSIVKKLTELMGGTIKVESTPGKGSTFHVSIPFAKLPEGQSIEALPSETGTKDVDLSLLQGLRVLVAEDDEPSQELYKDILTKAGMKFDIENNGNDALRAISEKSYDVVLMDLRMPDIDGLETARKMREDERLAHIPIIAVTADAGEEEQKKCRDAGMNDYIAKPIDKNILFSKIIRLLSAHTNEKASQPPAHSTAPPLEKPVKPTDENVIETLLSAGIDFNAASRRTGVSINTFIKILKIFSRNNTGTIEKLKRAIDEDNRPGTRMILHALRGSASNASIFEVDAAAVKLHDAVKENKGKEELIPLIAPVESALRKALNGINSIPG